MSARRQLYSRPWLTLGGHMCVCLSLLKEAMWLPLTALQLLCWC